MSDSSQGPGWWQASDGRWYPPSATPGTGPIPPGYGYGPPPGYGYPYGANPHGTATGLPSVANLSLASMVLGIIAVIPCFCGINQAIALVGLPLGIVALTRINKGEADPKGKGQAIAGIALGGIAIALGILFLVLFIISANSDPYALLDPGQTV